MLFNIFWNIAFGLQSEKCIRLETFTRHCSLDTKIFVQIFVYQYDKKIPVQKLLEFIVRQFRTSLCTVAAKNTCKILLLQWKKIIKIHSAPIPNFPLYSGCKKYLQKSLYQHGKNITNIKVTKIHSVPITNFPLYSGC